MLFLCKGIKRDRFELGNWTVSGRPGFFEWRARASPWVVMALGSAKALFWPVLAFGPKLDLGPMWGLCWAPGALLRRLKTIKDAKHNMFRIPRTIQVGLAFGGSKRGPSWGHVGVKLAIEGHLKTA